MCKSVPQMPVRSMRMRTSLMPTFGSGTSCSHRPGSDLSFTSAFMDNKIVVFLSSIFQTFAEERGTEKKAAEGDCLRKSLAQHGNTFWDRDVRIFLSFELEGDKSSISS